MEHIDQHIEALVFVSDQPLTIAEIKETIETSYQVQVSKDSIKDALERLSQKYQSDDFAIEVVEISEGYRFMTKGSYHTIISNFLKLSNKKKLTKSAMETLSIIAYRQPLAKSEMEEIRGVNCDYTVQKLMEKDLVEIIGRSDGPGRPLLYGTSTKFMDYFGLKAISDLPKIKEVRPDINTIGEEEAIVSPVRSNNQEE